MIKTQNKFGFTLIELSIALIIIGLVTGGILVGSEMLHAAKIRKTISQIVQAKTAFLAFKLKYGQYPGDFNEAAEIWSDGDAAINGNGDGRIEDGSGDAPPSYDAFNAFHHLARAEMIDGPYVPETTNSCTSCSLTAAIENSYIGVLYSANWTSNTTTNWLMLSSLKTPVESIDFLIAMLAAWNTSDPLGIYGRDAQAVDSKLDDGLPFTGGVISGSPQLGGNEQLSCPKTDGSNAYNLGTEFDNCVLWMPIEK